MSYRTAELVALGYIEIGAFKMGEACEMQAVCSMRKAFRHAHHVYAPEFMRLRF